MNENKEMFQGWYTMFKRERELINIENRGTLLLLRRMDRLVKKIIDKNDPILLSARQESFEDQVNAFLKAILPMDFTKIDASVSLNMSLEAWRKWSIMRSSF